MIIKYPVTGFPYELVQNENFYLEEDEIFLLTIASKYYTEQRYPVVDKESPTKEEIKEMIDLADKIHNQICELFDIHLKSGDSTSRV